MTTHELPPPATDEERAARAKVLASATRMRVLRLCLHEARTNKELAEALGVNPGSMLHHVRALVDGGFLVADEERRGARGAREVPYRATRLSWGSGSAPMGPVLIETFLQEIVGLAPEELEISRLGLKLSAEHRDEFRDRMYGLLQEFAARPSDDDGEPISVFVAQHPDRAPR